MAKFTGIPWDILLQGFHWHSHDAARNGKPWWVILKECAPAIKAAGFTWVWFPPCSDSLAPEGYMPRRWFAFDSAYGTEVQLRAAIDALAPETRALADVVINHRVGLTGLTDFADPSFGPTPEDNLKAIVGDDPTGQGKGRFDTGEHELSSRDLDHANLDVQEKVQEYLARLLDLGFRGWRYDLVKGYDGMFVGQYNERSLAEGELSIGESFDGDAGKLLHWLEQTGDRSSIFDYPHRFALLHAIHRDDYGGLRTGHEGWAVPPGVLGRKPEQAVTFLDNHDTEYRRGGNEHFGGTDVAVGYACLLTHPGIPCVFWPHFFDWDAKTRETIAALMKLRQDAGVTSGSRVRIAAAEPQLYAAFVDNALAVKLGSDLTWSPGAGWRLALSGDRFAVWRK